jgi:hypothetical protein
MGTIILLTFSQLNIMYESGNFHSRVRGNIKQLMIWKKKDFRKNSQGKTKVDVGSQPHNCMGKKNFSFEISKSDQHSDFFRALHIQIIK